MRAAIRLLDGLLCRLYGVFEFCDDPECILRLSMGSSPHPIRLKETLVNRGEPVIFLHLWNEHMLPIPPRGPDLAWGIKILRSYRRSLGAVAGYMTQHPELRKRRAVGGVTSLLLGDEHAGGSRILQTLGFSITPYHSPLGAFGEFWENIYARMLIWTYNPGSLPYHRFGRMRRMEFWADPEEFLARCEAGAIRAE